VIKALVLALLAAGCAGPSKPPKFDDIPPVSAEFIQRQKAASAAMTVRIFNTGHALARWARLVSTRRNWRDSSTLQMPAFLIRHPTAGLILFDTGLHPGMEKDPVALMGRIDHWVVPFAAGPGQTLVNQLKATGINPGDIKKVVISHLHMDHTGAMEQFPNAQVYVSKNEWDVRRRSDKKMDWSAMDARVNLQFVDFALEPSFGSFDHGRDLLGDGSLVLVDLAGHTAGSMGLWVNLKSGPVLLAGDASWVMDNHRDMALPVKLHIHSVEQYWRRLFQMRAAQEAIPELVIFPGHDLAPLQLQPRPDVSQDAYPH
jgi:N-acyl homoserine lactone hydrolase